MDRTPKVAKLRLHFLFLLVFLLLPSSERLVCSCTVSGSGSSVLTFAFGFRIQRMLAMLWSSPQPFRGLPPKCCFSFLTETAQVVRPGIAPATCLSVWGSRSALVRTLFQQICSQIIHLGPATRKYGMCLL